MNLNSSLKRRILVRLKAEPKSLVLKCGILVPLIFMGVVRKIAVEGRAEGSVLDDVVVVRG